MPNSPKSFRPGHAKPRKQVEQSWESRRNGNHDLYSLWIWRNPVSGIRAIVLTRDPLCVDCLKKGRAVPSTCADHDEPHNGDMEKFTDIDRIHGKCASCHGAKTATHEGGFGNAKTK